MIKFSPRVRGFLEGSFSGDQKRNKFLRIRHTPPQRPLLVKIEISRLNLTTRPLEYCEEFSPDLVYLGNCELQVTCPCSKTKSKIRKAVVPLSWSMGVVSCACAMLLCSCFNGKAICFHVPMFAFMTGHVRLEK